MWVWGLGAMLGVFDRGEGVGDWDEIGFERRDCESESIGFWRRKNKKMRRRARVFLGFLLSIVGN